MKSASLEPALTEAVLSPHVDDVSLTSSVTVVVQDDVAVSSIELSVCGRIHWHLIGSLDAPDLSRTNEKKTSHYIYI